MCVGVLIVFPHIISLTTNKFLNTSQTNSLPTIPSVFWCLKILHFTNFIVNTEYVDEGICTHGIILVSAYHIYYFISVCFSVLDQNI